MSGYTSKDRWRIKRKTSWYLNVQIIDKLNNVSGHVICSPQCQDLSEFQNYQTIGTPVLEITNLHMVRQSDNWTSLLKWYIFLRGAEVIRIIIKFELTVLENIDFINFVQFSQSKFLRIFIYIYLQNDIVIELEKYLYVISCINIGPLIHYKLSYPYFIGICVDGTDLDTEFLLAICWDCMVWLSLWRSGRVICGVPTSRLDWYKVPLIYSVYLIHRFFF